jgi:nitrate/TMAO reductase-like tetraheme cytochrome c subunit
LASGWQIKLKFYGKHMRCMTRLFNSFVLIFSLLCASTVAQADTPVQPRTNLPSYKQECAACHMAYPPGFLPAESWRRMVNTLPKHYGVDASIDDPVLLKEISGWLQANAGTYKRAGETTASHRMTDTAWFARKHREIADEVWKRVAIKSASNCIACHSGAERGDFNERAIRIPSASAKK